MMFYTDQNLEILSKSSYWLADGTFFVSPKKFSQLYIIHGIFFGEVVPLIYIFMKTKNQISYESIFNEINKLKIQCPNVFVIDFEIAVFNAISKIFPLTKINACNFHFNQLIVKFLKKNNLLKFYNIDN
ncbi:hypothetical protein DMUE_3433, partial [Dictyocoela muelleri]